MDSARDGEMGALAGAGAAGLGGPSGADGGALAGGSAGLGGPEPVDVDCNETIDRLYHFLDGELTEERRRLIQSHLDECGPCVEAFDFEAELRVVIASRCKDHVPDSLRERIRAALSEEEQRRS